MKRWAPLRGMALVAVLWIVAALSVMALALAGTARVQVRAASVQRSAASVQAVGEAVTALALQAQLAQPPQQAGAQHIQMQWQGVPMSVSITPLDGFIGLNGASAELLAAVLQSVGAGNAQALAEAIVTWRDGADMPPEERRQPRRFEAVEDLMLVPGMDYALYARIAPLVSADAAGSTVDARSAPPEVLRALAGGQDARVDAYVAQRAQPGADASFLNPAFAGAAGRAGMFYRVHVGVPLGEGTIARFECDVALRADTQRRLPWSVLRQSLHITAPQP